MECDVPRENGLDFQDMENKPNRLYIEGKCDETLTKLCKDVGWLKDFIAIHPERMAKAGITEERKEEKKQASPKAKGGASKGAAKLAPGAAKKAGNLPTKKGASPNKGTNLNKSASPNKGIGAKKPIANQKK